MGSAATIASGTSITVYLIMISVYTVFLVAFWMFFEMRLNTLHSHHIEKIEPLGVEGLKYIDRQLKRFVRVHFTVVYVISIVLILTIL